MPPGPAPGPHSPHQPSKRGLPVSSLPQPTTTSTSSLVPLPTLLQVQSCQGGNGGLTLASLLQTRLRTPLEVAQCVPLNTHTHTPLLMVIVILTNYRCPYQALPLCHREMCLFGQSYHLHFTDGELRLREGKQPKVTEHVSG